MCKKSEIMIVIPMAAALPRTPLTVSAHSYLSGILLGRH